MSYYGRRRRPSAASYERMEREKEREREEKARREAYAAVMAKYKAVPLSREESEKVWRAQASGPSRTFAENKDGVPTLLMKRVGGRQYLQIGTFLGWKFSRLVSRSALQRAGYASASRKKLNVKTRGSR